MFDFHMHSHFSADCSVQMKEMVESAIQKGMAEICFTDHIDYDYPDPAFNFDFDESEYDRELKQLQEHFGDRITIRKGVEIGMQPHLVDRYNQRLAIENYDFILLSLHTVDGKGLHDGELFHNRTNEEAFRQYYEELLDCLTRFDQYQIVSHLDLIKRYKRVEIKEDFSEIIDKILRTLIKKGKGIEVNTSGKRYGLPDHLPSHDILKRYYELGGTVITLGSDAHHPKDIGYAFNEVLHQLDQIGFKQITSYKNQQPVFHAIERWL